MNQSTSIPRSELSFPPRAGLLALAPWLPRLIRTDDDRAAMLARTVLAAVLFPHGAQHLTGWFGGYGFSGTLGWMTGSVGIPAPLAAFSIVFEFFAPLVLLVGFGGRVFAAGLAVFLAVAASTHAANGFFMNWLGNQAGEGFEYHLLAIALAASVAIRGSGTLSVDRWLYRRFLR